MKTPRAGFIETVILTVNGLPDYVCRLCGAFYFFDVSTHNAYIDGEQIVKIG
jgi:hypothetical protein